jgi:hypothetical protein
MRWGSRCYLSFSLDCTHEHTQKNFAFLCFQRLINFFIFVFSCCCFLVGCLFVVFVVDSDVEHLRQSNSSLDSGQSMWPSHRRSIGMHGPFSHENSPSGHLVHSSLLFHVTHTHTHMTRFDDSPVMYSNITQDIQLSII